MKARIVDFLRDLSLFVADHLAHHRLHQMIPYLAKLGFSAFRQSHEFEFQMVAEEPVQNYLLNSVRKELTHSDNYQDLKSNPNWALDVKHCYENIYFRLITEEITIDDSILIDCQILAYPNRQSS